MNKNKKLIFILGSAYSGSTLLGNLLNTYANTFHMGEINRLSFLQSKYQTANPLAVLCFHCALEGHTECKFWTDKYLELIKDYSLDELYLSIFKKSGKNNIVDGSKHAFWFQRVLSEVSDDLKSRIRVVVSVKNPMGSVNSLMNRTDWNIHVASAIWRDTYYDIYRTLSNNMIPSMLVKYEDLVVKNPRVIKSLEQFLDLSKKTRDHVSNHSVGGNLSAFMNHKNFTKYAKRMEKEKKIYTYSKEYDSKEVDEKWMKYLKEEDIAAIIQTPALADMANLMGYDLVSFVKKCFTR